MRVPFLIAVFLFLAINAPAQKTDCDPLTESQLYGRRSGKVLSVNNENKLTVRVVPSNAYTGDPHEPEKPYDVLVTLVGIDTSVNSKGVRAFLLDQVLNHQVTVIGNAKNARRDGITALVQLDDHDEIDDISEHLIERGIAQFDRYTHGNIVPMCTFGDLETAEKIAKKDQKGIWVIKN